MLGGFLREPFVAAVYTIVTSKTGELSDAEISEILEEAYVQGGFTAPELAAKIFEPSAVRLRGEIIYAKPDSAKGACGMIVLVQPDSLGKKLPDKNEAELQLLAVKSSWRRIGIGRALVTAALNRAKEIDVSRISLWTQPSMTAAQRLYKSAGFTRNETRDFSSNGCQFLVYELKNA